MAFEVPTGKAATAVIFLLDIQHDLGAASLRPRIERVGVRDDDVCALCLGSADFVRLLHQLAEFRLPNRSEHDHPVAEAQLRSEERRVGKEWRSWWWNS